LRNRPQDEEARRSARAGPPRGPQRIRGSIAIGAGRAGCARIGFDRGTRACDVLGDASAIERPDAHEIVATRRRFAKRKIGAREKPESLAARARQEFFPALR
jgi:hypothetical protein